MGDRPNIVIFFSDQQRWDTCGCYGQPMDVTPNLDAMARSGVLFSHAFSCQPVCGPARAALQSGRYPTEVGCHTNHRRLPEDVPTIAKSLNAAGYQTAYIGKWHLASRGPAGGPDDLTRQAVPTHLRGGWDYWLAADALEHTSHGWDGHVFDGDGHRREIPAGRFRADAMTDWAVEWLEQRSNARPFALMVSYIEPHHQNDHGCCEGPRGSRERFADFVVPGDLAALPGVWREEYPEYLGSCNALDGCLGRILTQLEKRGERERTLVISTADHGNHFQTRGPEFKRSCHDASARIPLVVAGPGFVGGRRDDRLANLIDVPATILAAAGAAPLPLQRGVALQRPASDRPGILIQISGTQVGRALRTPRWTYSVRAPGADAWNDPGSSLYVEEFLYDNQADPHQLLNLVREPALTAERGRLATDLIAEMRRVGEEAPEIRPAA